MTRVALVLAGLVLLVPGAGSAGRAFGDSTIFARIGQPGMPEGIAVNDGVVYVTTHASARGKGGGPPSKIFMFGLNGAPLGEITAAGQDQSVNHGLLAMAFDAAGRLYVVDRNPGRVLRFDLTTSPPTQETYATIPNLPACRSAPPPCSPTILDQATFADYLTFDEAGDLYVTEFEAATIFRIPAVGTLPRDAEIWFQDTRLDSIFGPNGIQVGPDGKLYVAMTGSLQPTSPAQGLIYRLPLGDAPQPSDLELFHQWLEPAVGPDGIAFGATGKLYVALAGHSQVSVLNPDGSEAARFPDAVQNQMAEVPYDLPASIAFDGSGSILVTNQSYFTATPEHWVVFDAWVDDIGLPPIKPVIS